ncbi:GLIPR1-like protein 1 [Patella vulgata]|uniref:GLIPR1-like protein 1 n=1 Tax=Patella vulgata TaxID=6465 RepID=UPI0024A97DC1|nr:GLIPR1-like protein 1 [Patella vulgata]
MLFGVLVLTFVIAMVHGEMTEEAKAQLLKLHNEHRANLGASNMFKLRWDDELQKAAEEWNNGCVYDHKGRGENLAWNKPAEPLPVKELIDIAFTDWYNEKNLHSYGSGQCSRFGSCHYTQLAWHDTTKLGCSYRTCSNLANADAGAWWIVCLYKPWGNNGGEKVFEMGTACSHRDCKSLPCENKLCVGEKKIECKDGNDNCPEWKKGGQCESNPDYMKKNCPMACQVCEVEENESSSKPTNDCEDESTECKNWAETGHCAMNPSYMLKSCKKSCNRCQ